MNKNAEMFLADLDFAYWRSHPKQSDDYCLTCMVPGCDRVEFGKGCSFCWQTVIGNLLSTHNIPFNDFLIAWNRESGHDNPIESLLNMWERGYSPSHKGCDSRESVVKALNRLSKP